MLTLKKQLLRGLHPLSTALSLGSTAYTCCTKQVLVKQNKCFSQKINKINVLFQKTKQKCFSCYDFGLINISFIPLSLFSSP